MKIYKLEIGIGNSISALALIAFWKRAVHIWKYPILCYLFKADGHWIFTQFAGLLDNDCDDVSVCLSACPQTSPAP